MTTAELDQNAYNVAKWKLLTIVSIIKTNNLKASGDHHKGQKWGIPIDVMAVNNTLGLGQVLPIEEINAAYLKAFTPEAKTVKRSSNERLGKLVTNIGYQRKELLGLLDLIGVSNVIEQELFNNVPLTYKELLHVGIDLAKKVEQYLQGDELKTAESVFNSKRFTLLKGRVSNRVYNILKIWHPQDANAKQKVLRFLKLQKELLNILTAVDYGTPESTMFEAFKLTQWQPRNDLDVLERINNMEKLIDTFTESIKPQVNVKTPVNGNTSNKPAVNFPPEWSKHGKSK